MRTEPLQRELQPDSGSVSFEHDEFDEALDLGEQGEFSDRMMEEPNPNSRTLDAETIMLLTARLAQVLAEETDLLTAMRVSDIEKLQREKVLLVDALEKQKRLIESRPELLSTMTDEQALELAQIIEIFQSVMKENHRRLLIAREVNRKVVEAISDAVSEANQHQVYDNTGAPEMSQSAIAVSLNKQI
ncbi:MAG: hypothetical protein U1E36_04080 [Rickettsiales bacterium]